MKAGSEIDMTLANLDRRIAEKAAKKAVADGEEPGA
jgi:hypothetical protein